MDRIPHIAVFIATTYRTMGDTLRGILSYSRTHSYWSMELKTGRNDEKKLEDVDWSSYDGAIIDKTSTIGAMPVLLQQIHKRQFPVVFITDDPIQDFPGCILTCDNAPIANTAAAYLLSKHCVAYAFVHAVRQPWSEARGRLFAEAIKTNGKKFLI